MSQQFIKVDCKGVLSFVPVNAKDAQEKAKKFKKDFDGEVAKDEEGKLIIYTTEDLLEIKGKSVTKTDNIEKLNDIFG